MNSWDSQADTATIRSFTAADRADILVIINSAAEAYRGVIPANCWREPYMPETELVSEIAAGVVFLGCTVHDRIVGVMGIQRRNNVDLIRHAYVLPEWQGRGIGSMLLGHLCCCAERPTLIGTWRAADWAIRFYERHGFGLVRDDDVVPLLRAYWNVPERQIAKSVVLASPGVSGEDLNRLVAEVPRSTLVA